jgi:hypothetical protein
MVAKGDLAGELEQRRFAAGEQFRLIEGYADRWS